MRASLEEEQRSAERRLARRRQERRKRERRRRRAMYRRRRATAVLVLGCCAGGAFALFSGGGGGGGGGGGAPADPVAIGGGATASRAEAITASLRPRPPGPTVTGATARRLRVPILMYHAISIPSAGASFSDLFVPTADFASQMQALQRDGYEPVTLDRLFGAWQGTGTLPRKPIVLTFDDGYESQYDNAAPVLRKLGWPGVLNLALKNLTQGEMSAAMLKRMIADGWEIDSHTIDHLDVSKLDGQNLLYEVAQSRATLQQRLGVQSDFFCFPAGRFDKQALAAVRAAGYTGATTELPGDATASGSPFKLPRIRINHDDGVSGMEAKLAGAAQS